MAHRLIIDCGPFHCRWPITSPPRGEGDGTLFCAAPTDGDRAYCADHAKRAYVASVPLKRLPRAA